MNTDDYIDNIILVADTEPKLLQHVIYNSAVTKRQPDKENTMNKQWCSLGT